MTKQGGLGKKEFEKGHGEFECTGHEDEDERFKTIMMGQRDFSAALL